MKITDNPYFREQGYIDGIWCDAKSKDTVEVIDPATNQPIGTVPNMATEEAKAAVDAAAKALPTWRALTAHQRSTLLQRWFQLIQDNKRQLAELMTFEQGKPVAEAEGEITYAASFIEWFAEQGKRTNGEIIPSPSSDKRLMVIKQGIGVCAAITPWNFPAAMITRKAAPALAAGCTMVIKPANETPYTALALAELAAQAGIPAGVINIVTGDAVKIGEVFTSDNRVRKLSFTGSTGVGRLLMRQCADSVKKVSLELGGNAPFIVFNDADIEKAVAGAMGAKFRNAGQTCVCANRFYIHKDVYQQFSERFVAEVKKLKVGNGFTEGVTIGPLINHKAVEKSQSLLADTLQRGATLLCGGERDKAGENFFQPTVVGNVPADSHILEEEIFGPVAPLVIFDNEEEVVHLANNTIYGLAAYFYSEDPQRIWRVAENLEYGMVGINTGLISNEVAPFGGIKQSGLGREGSEHGIEDFISI